MDLGHHHFWWHWRDAGLEGLIMKSNEIIEMLEAEWRDKLKAAVLAEREASAKLCWLQRKYWDAQACADAIRARGQE